jgi:ribose transport system ATP-binding protein
MSGLAPGLAIRSVSKRFAGVEVLSDVSADIAAGRITAVLGQNGSGKSTLVKILAGFHLPEPGATLAIRGVDVAFPMDATAAHRHGLRFVHQDLALVGKMTVANNIAFAQGFAASSLLAPISRRRHRDRAREAFARLRIDVDPEAPMSALSATERTLVAIARAIDVDVDVAETVIVLDEPTAYLPASAVDRVLELLDTIRSQGGTVIYVTHRLDEVVRVADDLMVLRDGRLVANRPLEQLRTRDVAELILGHSLERRTDARSTSGRDLTSTAGTDVLLKVSDLRGSRIDGVSFELHEGEILGVAGLVGCGRSELIRIVGGAQQREGGSLAVAGQEYDPRDPRAALARGVGYVPANRAEAGVAGDLSLRANVTLGDLGPFWSRGRLDVREERNDVRRLIDGFGIRPSNPEQPLGQFSGGNQQKAVIAKILRLNPRILAIDEPTQGIDVGGKADIAALLRGFAARGSAVLAGSSELDEITALCDRVLVLDRGRPLGIFDRGTVTEHRLALLAARGKEGIPT